MVHFLPQTPFLAVQITTTRKRYLPKKYRQYSDAYWEKRTFAPSSLLFYIGFDKKIKNVAHHTLFFDVDFEQHAKEIYDTPVWPTSPLFYANFTSITQPELAPDGKETGFFLVPIAPGLEDTQESCETPTTKK